MSERKRFAVTLGIIVLIILLISVFSFSVNNFRQSSDKLFSVSNAREYNSILIRNFSFDSMILGTSLSQGFKCSEFDAAFGGESIKLSAAAANFAEMNQFMAFAVKHKKVKRAMIDAPVHFFPMDQSLKEFPEEYYSESNLTARVKKSMSINAFIDEFDFFTDRMKGKVKYTNRDDLYDWNRRHTCSEKVFAKHVLYRENETYLPDDAAYARALEHAETVALPLFKAYPETEFIVFFPPLSMLFYKDVDCNKYIALKEKIVDLLLACPNVRLYDFETAFDIMTDYNNFKDYIHYSGKINSRLIAEMAQDNYRLTGSSKRKALDDLANQIQTYDYQRDYDRLAAAWKKKE
jgi:hypothetical protein